MTETGILISESNIGPDNMYVKVEINTPDRLITGVIKRGDLVNKKILVGKPDEVDVEIQDTTFAATRLHFLIIKKRS